MRMYEIINEMQHLRLTLHRDSQYALELATQLQNRNMSRFESEDELIGELLAILVIINESIKQ